MRNIIAYFGDSNNGNTNRERKRRSTAYNQADIEVIQLDSDNEEPLPKRNGFQGVMSPKRVFKPVTDVKANNAGDILTIDDDVITIDDELVRDTELRPSSSNSVPGAAPAVIQIDEHILPDVGLQDASGRKAIVLIDLSGDADSIPEILVENLTNNDPSENDIQEVSDRYFHFLEQDSTSDRTERDQGQNGHSENESSEPAVVTSGSMDTSPDAPGTSGNSYPGNLGLTVVTKKKADQSEQYEKPKKCGHGTRITFRKSMTWEIKASRYMTTYMPHNVPKNDFKQWQLVGRQASEDQGDPTKEYWIENVVNKRVNGRGGKPEYLIKYMGYSLMAGGQVWWLTADRLIGNCSEEESKITHYERRENVMRKFANLLKKQEKGNFDLKYPNYKRRKQFSEPNKSSDYSRHVDQLIRKESYINYLLDCHGQKPLYFVNWTDSFELSDDAMFMERPSKWNESSRKSLSFEYLLTTDVPQDILEEIRTKEAKEYKTEGSTFKCACEGNCSSTCPCYKGSISKFNKVKVVRNNVIFGANPGDDDIFLSCGPKCRCSAECIRRTPSRGRQYPLIIFYNENKGWGVHAACTIPKGSFIGMYTGILDRIRPTEDAHYQFLLPTGHTDSSSDDDCIFYALDCGRAGNEFGIINHSCKYGNVKAFSFANCNSLVIYEIGFIATRDIEFGEELCYNYELTESAKVSTENKDDEKPRVKCCCRPDCPNFV